MGNLFTSIRDGLNIKVSPGSPGLTTLGDVTVNSSTSNLQYYNGSSASDIATATNTLSFQNKTLDASINTISNIVNANIAAGAAIAYNKLALAGSILGSDISSTAAIPYSTLSLSGAIQNSDLAGSISYSKLVLGSAIQNSDLATMATGTFKGNVSGSTANPSNLTISQVNTALATITALTSDVSASGAGGSAVATVNSVGGSTAANIHTAELLANASTASATANTIVKRDANSNTQINNVQEILTVNSSSVSLTVASSKYQTVSGPFSLNFTLPDATTLNQGQQFVFTNTGNGLVVKLHGGTTVMAVPLSFTLTVTLTSNGSTDGVWANDLGLTSPSSITPIFRALDTSTSLTTNTVTTVAFDSVTIDTSTSWNVSTGEYTVKNAGYYKIDCNISFAGTYPSSNANNIIYLYVNGSIYSSSVTNSAAGNTQTLVQFSELVSSALNDTFQIKVLCSGTSPSMFTPRLIITQIPSVFYT